MALLSQDDLDKVVRAIQRDWSRSQESVAFTKVDLVAAISATDAWINSNDTSFNNALPTNFKNGATLAQKYLLFLFVATKRASRVLSDED